jgi:hypothetical protein
MGGQTNILFGSIGNGGGAALKGARNGVSVDTGGYVVLGEDIGEAGSPAALLSDREVPMAGFYLNLFDGNVVISDAGQAPSGAGLLQIIRNNIGSGVDIADLALINTTPATDVQNQNSPTLLLQGNGWDQTALTSKAAQWEIVNNPQDGSGTVNSNLSFNFSVDGGGQQTFLQLNTFGQIVGGVFTGDAFITTFGIRFDATGVLFNLANDANGTGLGTLYLWDTSTGIIPTAFAAANMDDGTNREYYLLGWNEVTDTLTLNVHATGTGIVRPVAFLPNIMFGGSVAPTAKIHIAASSGASGSGPLKLTAGTLLGAPEPGSIEYDGTHFYATTSTGVRQIITIV